MIYYNLTKTDVLKLKLQWQIGELRKVDTNTLFNYLDNFKNQQTTLENFLALIRDSNIIKANYNQVYSYSTLLLKSFIQKYDYSLIEQQYILMYIILLMLRNPLPYVGIVYNQFQILPRSHQNKTVLFLRSEIIKEIIPYYISLGKDTSVLASELTNLSINDAYSQ